MEIPLLKQEHVIKSLISHERRFEEKAIEGRGHRDAQVSAGLSHWNKQPMGPARAALEVEIYCSRPESAIRREA